MTGSASTPPRSPSRSTATTSPLWARSSTAGSHTSRRLRSGSASTRSRPAPPTGRATPPRRSRGRSPSPTSRRRRSPASARSPGSIVPGATVIAFDISDAGTGVAAGTLHVDVDGSDVASWGTLNGGHFSYAPGNLGAGVHTISVTVADNAGNVAGPVMWQFAVADPASLGLAAAAGPASIVAGHAATLAFTATSNGAGMAGARVLVSARPAGKRGLRPGADRHRLGRRAGRVLGLAGAHDGLPGRARGRPERPDRAHARRAPARDPRSVAARGCGAAARSS